MIYKTALLIAVLSIATNFLQAQHRSAPQYLLSQPLPDSVRNTALVSMNGSSITLSEVLDHYSGKKILVDFWASWCKDCIVSLPKYQKLIEKTEKQNVVFLLLSVDKEDSKWKAAITKFGIKGEHYRFPKGWKNPFSKYVDLDWIPRYLVIDEHGEITVPKSIQIDDKILLKALSERAP